MSLAQTTFSEHQPIGVVIIGRNEGERLRNCLRSVMTEAVCMVYVDSGSTDNSLAIARDLGADVIELDLTVPFTAARARNAGFKHLLTQATHPDYIQFVDGDCEIQPGWLASARLFLDQNAEFAIATGRRRERFPAQSIFNQMCDEEWDTPTGEALACGGDAMIRVRALQACGGYNDRLIAGEEPELCLRLRKSGWKIMRLDHEMTLHDANITRTSQWWRRTRRAGHAYAEGAWMHGKGPEQHYVRETARALLWGLALPLVILATAMISVWPAIALSLIYPVQVLRIALRDRHTSRHPWQHAFFLILGKFAEASGAIQFLWRKMLHRAPRLIEYK